MPDMSKEYKKQKKNCFHSDLFIFFLPLKNREQLDLLLGAVKEEYQGRGLTSILGIKLMKRQKYGLTYMDSHLVLESNLKMRAEVERLGAKIYKRYRVFENNLKCWLNNLNYEIRHFSRLHLILSNKFK